MKNQKTRRRLTIYIIAIVAATAICFDIAVATLDIVPGTFRYESEFDGVTAATTSVGIVTSDYSELTNPIERTTNPSYEQIEEMVGKAIELQGGFEWVIHKGDVVLIKVNLVGGTSRSGDGENTDVRVVKALIRKIHEYTEGDVTIQIAEGTARINDDPTEAESVWENCGYVDLLTDPMMDGINFSLLNINQSIEDLIEVELGSEGTSAIQGSKYTVHRAELEADVYIAVPVLKIHNTGITNTLKLQIGTAPGCYYGYNKSKGTEHSVGIYHEVDQRVWTTEAIVDLCNVADIDFVVVDAIMCLEIAKGYSADRQIRFNTILAGTDPVAIDHVSAKLMGLNPDDVAHITLAEKVGLGTNDPEHIHLEGVPLSEAKKRVKKSQHEDGKFGQSNRTWTLSRVFEGSDIYKENLRNEASFEPIPGEGGWSEAVYFFDDRIDLHAFYEGQTGITTYAFSYFEAEEAQEAELWLGSHEGIQVFLNGEEVYVSNSVNAYGDADRGEFKDYVNILKGRNTLLVKTVNNFGDYSFALNICEVESNSYYFGNRVDGLKFYLDGSGTTDTLYYEVWDLANLESIGGHPVTVSGDPQVVSTELGDAIEFDGDGDRLLVDFNPIMDAKAFTVELVFKPKACYPNNEAPRFVHIQNPDDPDGKRVMIELRVDENNECYMDGFIKTDSDDLALIDETLVHATEKWQHVAITYEDSTFTTYFNGIEELSGTLRYDSMIVDSIGKTSLGARMNEVAFYAGIMKTLKVSHACLDPEDFILPDVPDTTSVDTTITSIPILQEEISIDAFPIPADQFLKVKMEPGLYTQNAEVYISDLSGRIVSKQAYPQDGNALVISTSEFHVGVFIVSVKSQGMSVFRRVVVIH